jgi:hypothetical protein
MAAQQVKKACAGRSAASVEARSSSGRDGQWVQRASKEVDDEG